MNIYALTLFLGGFCFELAILYSQVSKVSFVKKIFMRFSEMLKKMNLFFKIVTGGIILFILCGALFTYTGIPFPLKDVYGSLSDAWVALPFTLVMVAGIFILLFDVRIMPQVYETSVVLILVPFWYKLLKLKLSLLVYIISASLTLLALILVFPLKKLSNIGKLFLYLFYLTMVALCSYWYFPVSYMSAIKINPFGAFILASAFVYFGIHWSVLLRFIIITLSIWRKSNRVLAFSLLNKLFSDKQVPRSRILISSLIFIIWLAGSFFLPEEWLAVSASLSILSAMQILSYKPAI
jgi:hypothetical protein